MKKIVSFIMAMIIAIIPMNLSFANEENTQLSVSSKSAILMDIGSGQILYEKNAHDKLPPASVTKVMTMLLICEALDSGKITLEDNKTFLLSDTVGFISKLPHNLVKAFRSTLEEIIEADLIIQVIDYSDKNYKKHIEVTNNTLKEIGVTDIPVIYVFNKSDLVLDKIPVIEENNIYMSALRKEGLNELVKLIKSKVMNEYILTKFLIPYDKGSIISYLKENSTILNIEYSEEGTIIELECKESDYNKYKEYIIKA